ncbi:Uncharacterized protein SCF082_LOCUS19962 [Durusdinium trenchii]|uniref:Peroxin-14 n=1 Tax=Durusdinium trenchii TaxID=1381693 RepID=A0ABP0KZ67_9DINO
MPQPPQTPQPPVRPMPPSRPSPVTPSYPSGPGYQAPPYPSNPYQQAPAPYGPVPPVPPMMYQGYPLPLEPPSTGGPWWAWLLGGLGAGLVSTYLANPFRLRPEDGLEAAEFFTDTPEKPKQESDLPKQSDTGGEPDNKASYEELLSLLRQQSEEAKANVSMCAKTLQQTQEQHQKMFAEMQKALQNTQKSSKPQTMELSASTIQALATMIQNAWLGA